MRAIAYSLLLVSGVALAGCAGADFHDGQVSAGPGFENGVERESGYVPTRSTSTGGAAASAGRGYGGGYGG